MMVPGFTIRQIMNVEGMAIRISARSSLKAGTALAAEASSGPLYGTIHNHNSRRHTDVTV